MYGEQLWHAPPTCHAVAVELQSSSLYTLYMIARWLHVNNGRAQRMNIARQHVLGLLAFYPVPRNLILWPLVLLIFIFNSQVHEKSVFLDI